MFAAAPAATVDRGVLSRITLQVERCPRVELKAQPKTAVGRGRALLHCPTLTLLADPLPLKADRFH